MIITNLIEAITTSIHDVVDQGVDWRCDGDELKRIAWEIWKLWALDLPIEERTEALHCVSKLTPDEILATVERLADRLSRFRYKRFRPVFEKYLQRVPGRFRKKLRQRPKTFQYADPMDIIPMLPSDFTGFPSYKKREMSNWRVEYWTFRIEVSGNESEWIEAYERRAFAFRCSVNQEDVYRAIDDYKELYRRTQDESYRYQIANCYLKSHDTDAALEIFLSLPQKPGHWGLLFGIVEAYVIKADYDAALKWIATILEEDPRHWHGYKVRGDIYRKIGDEEQARQSYVEAERINPNLWENYPDD